MKRERTRGASPAWLRFLPRLLVVLSCALAGRSFIRAQSLLPENNLDYALLLGVGGGTGSGFLVSGDSLGFLVTARHVLFSDPKSNALRAPEVTVSGYVRGQTQRFQWLTHLNRLQHDSLLLSDTLNDVAVIVMGRTSPFPDTRYTDIETLAGQVTGANKTLLRRYDKVIIGNDVFVFGYPRSLGLSSGVPQLDYNRPLIHKGVVAGKNPARKTIILDTPVYWGNSGGPVVEIENTEAGTKFVPIGVVTQYVPLEDKWANLTQGYTYSTRSISSYSVAAPLDTVLGFIKHWEK